MAHPPPNKHSRLTKRDIAADLQDAYHYFGSILAVQDHDKGYDTTFPADSLHRALECYSSGLEKLRQIVSSISASRHRGIPAELVFDQTEPAPVPPEEGDVKVSFTQEVDGLTEMNEISDLEDLLLSCRTAIEIIERLSKRLRICPSSGAVWA